MIHVAATKFKEHYGEYMESALSEPLVIQKHSRDSLVLLSYKKFNELEEIQKVFNDIVLKLQMDEARTKGEYVEDEKAVQRLKAYTNE